MIMDFPEVSFIRVYPEIVTMTSNEEVELETCMNSGGAGLEENTTTVPRKRYCQLMVSPESDATGDDLCRTYVMDTSIKVQTGNKMIEKSVADVVGPAATVAPVRSAPHFNNDLFN